jgi:hypothetical protein
VAGTRARLAARADFSVLLPDVDLDGTVAAYAIDDFSDEDVPGTHVTSVEVQDLRRPGDAHVIFYGYADPEGTSKVASIRVRRSGAVAWIACRSTAGANRDLVSGPRERCQRPGVMSWVFARQSDASDIRAVLLDRGRGIDPDSLRLRGSDLTWHHGDTVRNGSLR